jgi:hypothetical protein
VPEFLVKELGRTEYQAKLLEMQSKVRPHPSPPKKSDRSPEFAAAPRQLF